MAGTNFHEEKTAESDCVETGVDHDRCEVTDAGFK